MGYLRNAFKLNQSQRRVMVGLITILVLTSNRVQAADANGVLPDAPIEDVVQVEANDTKTLGFTVPVEAQNGLPVSNNVPAARIYHVSMTAYNSEVGQTDDSPFIAADGTRVFDGMVAANFLKFKTRVRIPALFGDKVFVVHDRMNKRYTDRMDVWMTNHSDAMKFGVKRDVVIEVL